MSNKEYNLPQNSGETIREILRKFKFDEMQKVSIKNFVESKNPEERIKLLKGSPGFILAQTVRDYAEDKINLEQLPKLLKDGLGISDKEADQIAGELGEKILNFIKPAAEDLAEKPAKVNDIKKSAEKPGPSKPDTYREQIK